MNHQLNRERRTDSVFLKEREEQRVAAQSRQDADASGLGCYIYLVFIKAEDEMRGVQEASIFKLCISVFVSLCARGIALCDRISYNDSYHC